MPWNFRDYFYLGILMCCVPLQYYLSNYNRLTSSKEIFEIVNNVRTIRERWFSLQSWVESWSQLLSWIVTNILGIEDSNAGESPAIEVLEYRKRHGIEMTADNILHDTRPMELWFHVGDVVEHIDEGYKAVVIEWNIDPERSSQPLYKLLVDEDPGEPSHVDIVEEEQEFLTLLDDTMITNRFIKNYFIAFDGEKYVPQPWLQELFPDD